MPWKVYLKKNNREFKHLVNPCDALIEKEHLATLPRVRSKGVCGRERKREERRKWRREGERDSCFWVTVVLTSAAALAPSSPL